MGFAPNGRVVVFDTTLRDGEQSPGAALNVSEKIEIAHMLEDMGVDVIEAGFPISSPGDFRAVQRISREIRGCVICGLTRANKKDIEVAAEALRDAAHPRIHTGLGVSDVHVQYKLRMTREEALARGVEAVKHARRFVADVEYFAEDGLSLPGGGVRHCGRRDSDQYSGHHGLYDPDRVRHVDPGDCRTRTEYRPGDHLGSLP
jgi:isopropylmalate/homocitrate/citramalate synthase